MNVPASLPDDPLALRYLEHVRVEKRLADRTVALYTQDLKRLQSLARQQDLALLQVHNTHIRRWVAQMHAQGRSGRGIALILSGWRSFYRWLGRQGLIDGNPVSDVRAPKAAKPLPKALGVDDAVQLAAYRQDATATPELEARDA
ncbi:MAG: recombinase XerC, partial [Betaproteobacteria bacterium]|nr:recombinase XerC [Betaproteobacteria bacterium]